MRFKKLTITRAYAEEAKRALEMLNPRKLAAGEMASGCAEAACITGALRIAHNAKAEGRTGRLEFSDFRDLVYEPSVGNYNKETFYSVSASLTMINDLFRDGSNKPKDTKARWTYMHGCLVKTLEG